MNSVTRPDRLASAWLLFALTTLGVSALYAVVLVLARTPFLGYGAPFFKTALVLHVNLAIVVWFLAAACAFWFQAISRSRWWHWIFFVIAVLATLLLVATPVIDRVHPLLTNYIPLIDHPFYVGGLVTFAVIAAIVGLATLPQLRLLRSEPAQAGSALAVLTLLISLFLLFQPFLWPPASPGGTSLDDLLWGGGHTFQFVHILLMMSVWCQLGSRALERVPEAGKVIPLAFVLVFLAVLAALLVAQLHPPGTIEARRYFTELMRWGTWPGPLLLASALITGLVRLKRDSVLTGPERGLMIALALFALGCVLGVAIRGDTLSVPAHYHATVGAVTVTYLAWMATMGRRMGIDDAALSPMQRFGLVYGAGVAILALGLGAAGLMGVPRKAAHIDLGTESAGYLSAMGVAGIGGLLGLCGILALVGLAVIRTLPSLPALPSNSQRDVRIAAIGGTAIMIVLLGLGLQRYMAPPPPETFNPAQHANDKLRADIKTRFDQGVIMLHAKQYEHAATAFHRVLQLAPEMPEAHVNMGFSMIGLKRYKAAYDFFDSATYLRRDQANAYYGMAVALEGMNDLPAAIAAMQTYQHLAKSNDPFRTKAEAALWEWREKLATAKQSAATGKSPAKR